MTVKPNDLIGGYHFVHELGQGATAKVWLAREKDTHLLVAIKLLRTELFPPSSAQVMYERLVASVTRAGRLTHPNLCQTRATFHHPRHGLYGIVTEYLEGQTLDGIFIPRGVDGRPGASDPRTLAGVLHWFQQAATVLAWLHANGIVHGDVKPKNVMLMTGYERPAIKLLDLCWSLAGLTGGAADDTRFLSPEQLAGGPATPSSDQWACAKLLHQLLVSSAPPGSQTQALATAPLPLLKVVQKSLQKEPRDRFPETGGLYYAIEAVRNQLEQEAGSTSHSWETEKRISETAEIAVAEEAAPTENPTVPMMYDRPPSSKSPVQVTQAMLGVDRAKGLGAVFDEVADPLAAEDYGFEPSQPPLIEPPSEGRRRIEREPTDQFAALIEGDDDDDDDDPKPPRNWMALVGVFALVAAFTVIVGALYMTMRSPEIPINDKVKVLGTSTAAEARADATKPVGADATKSGATDATKSGATDATKSGATDATKSGVTDATKSGASDATKSGATDATKSAATDATKSGTDASKSSGTNAMKPVGSDATKSAAADATKAGTNAMKPVGTDATKSAAADATKSTLEAELAALDADCTAKKASACSELGDRYASGKGAAKSLARAALSHERACDLGRLASCSRAGELFIHEGGATSAKSARRVLEKACDRQVAASCAELSRLYAEGVGGSANDRLAKAFKARACGFGLKSSCE